MKAEITRTATYYDGTYLKDDRPPDPTGVCSLFIRRFTQRRGPRSGKLRTSIDTDVMRFSNDQTMVDAIEEQQLLELPPEAERDRSWLPWEDS